MDDIELAAQTTKENPASGAEQQSNNNNNNNNDEQEDDRPSEDFINSIDAPEPPPAPAIATPKKTKIPKKEIPRKRRWGFFVGKVAFYVGIPLLLAGLVLLITGAVYFGPAERGFPSYYNTTCTVTNSHVDSQFYNRGEHWRSLFQVNFLDKAGVNLTNKMAVSRWPDTGFVTIKSFAENDQKKYPVGTSVYCLTNALASRVPDYSQSSSSRTFHNFAYIKISKGDVQLIKLRYQALVITGSVALAMGVLLIIFGIVLVKLTGGVSWLAVFLEEA